MALGFNRKKAAENAPDAPLNVAANSQNPSQSSPPTPQTADNLDLEAFAVPATHVSSSAPTSDSAFDFPEAVQTPPEPHDSLDFDQLFEIEKRNAAAATKAQAPAPFVPPSAVISEPATPFYAPQVPVETESQQPKRKLPLLPILGTLAGLALAGGAAYYFAGQKPAEDESAPIVSTRPGEATVSNPANASNSVAVTKLTPVPGGIKRTSPVVTAPALGAAPRIATDVSPVNPGIAPASSQSAQLKLLWKRGADAKHRGDFAGARRYWNQGLKIQPNNAGFRDSIAKLKR